MHLDLDARALQRESHGETTNTTPHDESPFQVLHSPPQTGPADRAVVQSTRESPSEQ